MSGMLLLVQGAGHLMFIILLAIIMYSPPACADRDVINGVSSPAGQGTDDYIFRAFSDSEIPFVHYPMSFLY